MKFRVPTTSQVERAYAVDAENNEQAHARLRTFLADPDLLKEGIVELISEKNVTEPKVKIQEIKAVNGRPASRRREPGQEPGKPGGEEKT